MRVVLADPTAARRGEVTDRERVRFRERLERVEDRATRVLDGRAGRECAMWAAQVRAVELAKLRRVFHRARPRRADGLGARRLLLRFVLLQWAVLLLL